MQDIVLSFFLSAACALGICSDKITVHNVSDHDMFVAFFYAPKKFSAHNQNIFIHPDMQGADATITRVSDSPILCVPAHGSFFFARPIMQVRSFFPLALLDRQMVCSMRQEFVEQFVAVRNNVVMQHMHGCVVHNVGIKNGKHFYIDVHEHDGVHIHNSAACPKICGKRAS